MSDPAPETPDVSVIIPVFNTMPYLTACLQSMVDQTIGADRMEVVAVDDGSTDGSGAELDRFAREHPRLFTVVHQDNSGGPARPCNRGLEVARGRYVFFLGADDYLARYALEDLVGSADTWESDVVMGRISGVGGRRGQSRFPRDERDVPFPHSQLPYALANTKLFRRSMLEEHGIRYPLDLRVGSDQPFTVAAMLHARRVSVLADKPYYYAVRRENSSNITFSSGWRARLEDIGTVMDHIAELVEAGDDRDQILHRHFMWELANRLRTGFLDLPENDQRALAALVRGLADRYLTDGVNARLSVSARLRLRLAQTGRLDELRAVVAAERDGLPAPVSVRGGRVRLALPGYGALPDDWFESRTENVVARLGAGVVVTSLSWHGSVLHLEAAGSALHPDSASATSVVLQPLPGRRDPGTAAGRSPQGRAPRPAVLTSAAELSPARAPRGLGSGPKPRAAGSPAAASRGAPEGSDLRAALDLAELRHRAQGRRRRWTARLVVDAGDRVFDVPLVADQSVPEETTTSMPSEVGWYRLTARVGRKRRLVVVLREPLPTDRPRRRDRLRAKVARLRPRS